MKTVLLDIQADKVEIVDVKDELSDFYDKLGCDMIELAEREISGKLFTVMCDEEGLLKDSPKISAIDHAGNPMLVGNLMFFHDDGEGGLLGLSDEDILHIRNHIQKMCTRNYPEGYSMLTQCEYPHY